jgi:hypothetical protein
VSDWYGAARALLDEHEAQITRLSQHMAGGGCADMGEYRATCGEIRGLGRAMDAIRRRLNDDEKRSLGIEPTAGAGSPKRKG